MQTIVVDSRDHARAKHAAYVRLARNQASKRAGDDMRALAARAPRQGRSGMTLEPEIAQAIVDIAERKERIAKAIKENPDYLRVTPYATRDGWHALYAARLIRENPVRTSFTRAELLARLRGETRELA